MPKKLIDLPCSVGELKKMLDNFNSQDVVVLHCDDSLHVFPVEEEFINAEKETKEFPPCKHRIGIHCGCEALKDSGHRRILAGLSPFVCPFNDGNECKEYEPERVKEESNT